MDDIERYVREEVAIGDFVMAESPEAIRVALIKVARAVIAVERDGCAVLLDMEAAKEDAAVAFARANPRHSDMELIAASKRDAYRDGALAIRARK